MLFMYIITEYKRIWREQRRYGQTNPENLLVKNSKFDAQNSALIAGTNYFIYYLNTATMYKVLFCVLLLYITSASAALQANETALYYQDYATNPLQSGDQTVLYLYIADTTDLDNAEKAIFFPKVDKFTRLEIMNSKLHPQNYCNMDNYPPIIYE